MNTLRELQVLVVAMNTLLFKLVLKCRLKTSVNHCCLKMPQHGRGACTPTQDWSGPNDPNSTHKRSAHFESSEV